MIEELDGWRIDRTDKDRMISELRTAVLKLSAENSLKATALWEAVEELKRHCELDAPNGMCGRCYVCALVQKFESLKTPQGVSDTGGGT
jgi:hypothetical protein